MNSGVEQKQGRLVLFGHSYLQHTPPGRRRESSSLQLRVDVDFAEFLRNGESQDGTRTAGLCFRVAPLKPQARSGRAGETGEPDLDKQPKNEWVR